MATYTNITQTEMEEFLLPKGFVQMSLAGVAELVYGMVVRKSKMVFTIRIYTGINPNGQSRKKGEDAIRVIVVWRSQKGRVYKVATSKRVHRVVRWRYNLQTRLDAWDDVVVLKCALCGSPMVKRKGLSGEFWGCCTYKDTQCKGKGKGKPEVTSV